MAQLLKMRHGWRALALLVTTALVLSLMNFVSPSPVRAEEAPAWPSLFANFDPSYEDATGMRVLSATPTIYMYAEDASSEATREYNFEFELRSTPTESTLVAADNVSASRSGSWSEAITAAEAGWLEIGETYDFRFRAVVPGDAGPWSQTWTFTVMLPGPAPALVSPSDNELTLAGAQLTAEASSFVPNETEMVFRVETNWEGGAPTTVGEYWATVDSSGVAVVAPNLTTNEGFFRWQAAVLDGPLSDWSAYRELRIGKLPSAVTVMYGGQNRSDLQVRWQPSRYSAVAPVQSYKVSLEPGGLEATVSAETLSHTFEDLMHGDYVATVTPANALGEGPPVAKAYSIGVQSPWYPESLEVDVDGRVC